MTAEEKFNYWVNLAQYDLSTADAMFSTGRWVYVIVMCQQATEKLCKGLYSYYVDDNVPKIHNIRRLAERFAEKITEQISEDKYTFFDNLTSYYIGGRYPEFTTDISALIKEDEAKVVLAKTKETFKWLLNLKK